MPGPLLLPSNPAEEVYVCKLLHLVRVDGSRDFFVVEEYPSGLATFAFAARESFADKGNVVTNHE